MPAALPESEELARLERFARLLDSSIRLPGGFRIGLDGIIGLIPGIGDTLAGAASGYIIYSAYRAGLPRLAIMHMSANVLIEMVLGAVPVAGDIFDFVFKANERNVRIMRGHMETPRPARRRSGGVLLLLAVAVLLTGVGISLAVVELLRVVVAAIG